MFFGNNNLNEGSLNGNRSENRNKELLEGENPKAKTPKANYCSWQSAKKGAHVNSMWQNLRK
ncbi:MAG: hypothetical protein L3J11_07095 [Draconibacterium sp.]|nr:hypothetical protein [Draconibacterium sp.]